MSRGPAPVIARSRGSFSCSEECGMAEASEGLRGRTRCCIRRGLVLGIDEAGRGPVVGPMVVAGVVADRESLEELRLGGVRDSKLLEPGQRSRLLEEILSRACYVVVTVHPPAVIDSVNLNRLEYETFSYIASRARLICPGLREVYADAVGPPQRLAAALARAAPEAKVVVEPKADRRYTAVSAASIVAKVLRDEEIERLRRLYGLRGSGYPTDPETLQWLRETYRRSPDTPPPIIRVTWGTLKRVAPKWYRPKQASTRRTGKGARQASLLDYLRRAGEKTGREQ